MVSRAVRPDDAGAMLDRRDFLSTAAMTLAATPFAALRCAEDAIAGAPAMPSFGSTGTWINSQPLTPAGLRGKVVLVNFCTYTCINWLRTLPHLRAWSDKYKDQGVVLIGVHTPEFEFEKNLDNVRRALAQMNITYPVVTDNDFGTWRAFNNQYWPALYFVDGQGRIRDQHFGEGDYDRSERVIQRLINELAPGSAHTGLVSVSARGIEAEAEWQSLRSPETYVGYHRGENFAGRPALDEARVYAAPPRLQLNQWALSGNWTIGPNAAVANDRNARITYRFHARDLHVVLSPGRSPARVRVTIDGQPPGAVHGIDIDERGNGTVSEARLHQLIRQQQRVTDRTCDIEFLDAGAEAFAFTFG